MIKTIYASNHGRSKRVANTFGNCHNVTDNPSLDGEIILFICPTYGDEELPEAMENFINQITIKNKMFCVCELGNYYGYDDFGFGAKRIIQHKLLSLDWHEFFPALSLDSMPIIDWPTLNDWKRRLENAIENYNRNNCQVDSR